MSEREFEYYEDQKSTRLKECDHGVDPVWYTAMMRKQRERERSELYKKRQAEQFLGKDLHVIEELLEGSCILLAICQHLKEMFVMTSTKLLQTLLASVSL